MAEEKKRQAEWDRREQRIALAIKRMGDNVIKKQELADKDQEEKLR